jgi:hypothetical protein
MDLNISFSYFGVALALLELAGDGSDSFLLFSVPSSFLTGSNEATFFEPVFAF